MHCTTASTKIKPKAKIEMLEEILKSNILGA